MKYENEKKSQALESSNLINDPSKKWSLKSTRYYIFFFDFWACAFATGINNFPSGIQANLMEEPYNFTNFEYGIFYGITGLPNIILPLLVGNFLDKYGFKSYMIVTLEISLMLGMILITFGSYYTSYICMVFGRVLMGIGSENLQVLIKRFILLISTKEESTTFWGVFLVSIRVGWIIGSAVPPLVYSASSSVTITFMVCTLFGLLTCISIHSAFILFEKTSIPLASEEQIIDLTEEKPHTAYFNQLKNFFKEAGLLFWLSAILLFLNFTVYSGIGSEANVLIMDFINVSSVTAGYYLIYYNSVMGICQPFIGFVFARIGYLVYSVLIGSLIMVISMVIFIEIYQSNATLIAFLPLGLTAFGYDLCSNFVFSSVGFIIEKKYYGIAFGVVQSGIEFGGLFGPVTLGIIKDLSLDNMYGYFWVLVETGILELIIFILGIFILLLDYFNSKKICSKRQNK